METVLKGKRMTLPEGRKPLSDEDIKRLLEICASPLPELTDEVKDSIQRYKENIRNRADTNKKIDKY
jgi:hypothetical protein